MKRNIVIAATLLAFFANSCEGFFTSSFGASLARTSYDLSAVPAADLYHLAYTTHGDPVVAARVLAQLNANIAAGDGDVRAKQSAVQAALVASHLGKAMTDIITVIEKYSSTMPPAAGSPFYAEFEAIVDAITLTADIRTALGYVPPTVPGGVVPAWEGEMFMYAGIVAAADIIHTDPAPFDSGYRLPLPAAAPSSVAIAMMDNGIGYMNSLGEFTVTAGLLQVLLGVY